MIRKITSEYILLVNGQPIVKLNYTLMAFYIQSNAIDKEIIL